MALRFGSLFGRLFSRNTSDSGNRTGRKALITGTVAVGALVTGAVLEKRKRTRLPVAPQLPHAFDTEVREMKVLEGVCRYYIRPGQGVPIVLLHSINAAGSSFEMKPLFDRYATTTERPIYALDWMGFGLSDRRDIKYRPGLYQRQLRRFLTEHVRQEADIVALSLGCEYAAAVANAFPAQVRRMAFIAPTALGRNTETNVLQRAAIAASDSVGAFEIFFSQLTRKEALRKFYEQNIFSRRAAVPDDLIEYGFTSAHARGSHYAPRYFVEGLLFMNALARKAYGLLQVPTLFVIPTAAPPTVQSFERASEVQQRNASAISLGTVDTGLLPQWENLDALMDILGNHFAA